MLSPAFSPPSPFHSLETSVNGKRSKRERERKGERKLEEQAKIWSEPDEENEERWLQWRGVVRRHDERNRSFRQRGWKSTDERITLFLRLEGGVELCERLHSWPIESSRYWASGWWNESAIGDWWFVEAKVAMDVVWSRVVSVCMCVCGSVGFLTGFEQMFDDFEDLGMVLNFRKNDLILKTKCMERNWRRVNQRWISEWNLFFFQFQV